MIILIQCRDLFWIEHVHKKLYVDDLLVQSFKGDSTTIRTDGKPAKLKLEILGGLFSTTCELQQSEESRVVEFENKHFRPIQWITILVALYVILDVICLK